MINKNDCFDCANCIIRKEDWFKRDRKWFCEVTGEPIPKDGTQENDCVNFKYEE